MAKRSLSVKEASSDAVVDDDSQPSITTILASIRACSEAEKAAFGDACGDRVNTALPGPFARSTLKYCFSETGWPVVSVMIEVRRPITSMVTPFSCSLVRRQAHGAMLPESFCEDPLVYQGGSNAFLGARAPIPLADPACGCDLEAEIVVVTGDVPQGLPRELALSAIYLIGLTNDVSLRNLIRLNWQRVSAFTNPTPPAPFPCFRNP